MEDIFGVKSDINNVVAMTEEFLSVLKGIREKNEKAVLNPNYVNLLHKLFKSPDIMMFRR